MSSVTSPYVFPTLTKLLTGNYNILDESMLICNTDGGSFTVTLPARADAKNRRYYIKKADNSANIVTIAVTDGNIEGNATFDIAAPNGAVVVVTDGIGWFIF